MTDGRNEQRSAPADARVPRKDPLRLPGRERRLGRTGSFELEVAVPELAAAGVPDDEGSFRVCLRAVVAHIRAQSEAAPSPAANGLVSSSLTAMTLLVRFAGSG